MIIGKMKWRIKLQKPNLIPDGAGGFKPATGPNKWADVTTIWAEFRIPNVKELAATGTIVSDLIRQISIRRRTDVRRGWQVLYGTKKFAVQHTFDYDLETTVLVCQEVVR